MVPTDAVSWSEGNDLINELGDERWLGQRIQEERKRRGWSQAELSRQMAKAGYPLHQSAISKIEPVDPDQTLGRRRSGQRPERRSVTIAEVKGFSKVFGIPFGELLLPRRALDEIAAWREYVEAGRVLGELTAAQRNYRRRLAALQLLVQSNPRFAARVAEDRAARAEGAPGSAPAAVGPSDPAAGAPERVRQRLSEVPLVAVADAILVGREDAESCEDAGHE